MSEPTYRVDLAHDPGDTICTWSGQITRLSDGERLHTAYGATREEAFEEAQAWIRRVNEGTQAPSSVYLDEDGDLLDRSEVEL